MSQINKISGDYTVAAMGSSSNLNTANGTLTFLGDQVIIPGDLIVTGTIGTGGGDSAIFEDKIIVLNNVPTPTDVNASGGGMRLLGDTDKTWFWENATDAWTSSENIDLASGKAYYINGQLVLDEDELGDGIRVDGGTF